MRTVRRCFPSLLRYSVASLLEEGDLATILIVMDICRRFSGTEYLAYSEKSGDTRFLRLQNGSKPELSTNPDYIHNG